MSKLIETLLGRTTRDSVYVVQYRLNAPDRSNGTWADWPGPSYWPTLLGARAHLDRLQSYTGNAWRIVERTRLTTTTEKVIEGGEEG